LLRDDDLLLVNGRWLLLDDPAPALSGDEVAAHAKGDIAYVRVRKATAARFDTSSIAAFLADAVKALPNRETQANLICWTWDLVLQNGKAILDDFKRLGKRGVEGRMSEQAAVWGPKDQLFVGGGSVIEPFVCLDTTEGPILIEENVTINPFTRVQGPAVIGRKSLLLGAKVREGTTIGPVCRVGGEVEEAIIHGHSNKYHDGFLGHAYVCEWVNLGALTTNSDLKNDYGNVEVYVDGDLVDTGSTKVGCCVGDHTKTSIGTLINTGTMIGMMSNIVGAGCILPKVVPSFITFLQGKMYKAGIESQLQTARTAMGRRKVEMLPAEEELIRACLEITQEERAKAIKKSR
jgi:UDP-N-acetylglucosamine diphosphorylase/glucosamine-1-phosphate N-acetyltransferase